MPSNITVYTDTGSPTANVTWPGPTADDNSGNVTLTSTVSSGAAFPIGITVVTYTAVDGSGNQCNLSFTVTVIGMLKNRNVVENCMGKVV